ncbi:hypothetical protein HUJ04_005798 [Dendroctonus ponderosae]|nr:hypothetical protein HUJ04_005798 [Dendroctonus ponderosae]
MIENPSAKAIIGDNCTTEKLVGEVLANGLEVLDEVVDFRMVDDVVVAETVIRRNALEEHWALMGLARVLRHLSQGFAQ